MDADHAEPTLVATDAMEEPVVVEEEDDEDETLVFKARGKRSRPQADSKGGAADASDDVSPEARSTRARQTALRNPPTMRTIRTKTTA